MLLRRLSILASMLVAACVPAQLNQRSDKPSGGYHDAAPSRAELAAWRAAIRENSPRGYRGFIRKYPRSRYVALATSRIATAVPKQRVAERKGGGDRSNGSGGSKGRDAY